MIRQVEEYKGNNIVYDTRTKRYIIMSVNWPHNSKKFILLEYVKENIDRHMQ